MVVTKIVDLLIETFAHEIGHDLYAQGENIALTNLLYFAGPTFIGRTRFDKLLASFVEMLCRPSFAATDRFYGIVESAFAASTEDGLRPQLGILRATRHIAEDLTAAKDDSALDPAIPAFFLLAAEWTTRLASPFTVLHDESKPLKNEQIILEAMMSTSEPPQTIGDDRRTHPFPLAATGIVFGSSKVEPMLQLADILAGSAALVLRCRAQGKSERFAEEIMKTDALSGAYAPVWPHFAIDPEEMGTNAPAPRADPHQLVGDYIANRLGGIPPVGQRRKS